MLKEFIEKLKTTVVKINEGKIEPSLKTRTTAPYHPILKVQTREFPLKDALSFDNYLTEIF
jgi:hypothetical protein